MNYLYFSLQWAVKRDIANFNVGEFNACRDTYFVTPFFFDKYRPIEEVRNETGYQDLIFVGTGIKLNERPLKKLDDLHAHQLAPKYFVYQEQLNYELTMPENLKLDFNFKCNVIETNILNTILSHRFDLISEVVFASVPPITSVSRLINAQRFDVLTKYNESSMNFSSIISNIRNQLQGGFIDHLRPFFDHFKIPYKAETVEKHNDEEEDKGFSDSSIYNKMRKSLSGIKFKSDSPNYYAMYDMPIGEPVRPAPAPNNRVVNQEFVNAGVAFPEPVMNDIQEHNPDDVIF